MKQWEIRGFGGLNVADQKPTRVLEAPLVVQDSFRTLVDQMPAWFWTTDGDLRFTSSLGGGVSGAGLGPNQIVGTTLYELLDTPHPRVAPIAAHQLALQGRPASFLITLAGHTFHACVSPLRDAQGRLIGTIGAALDTATRRTATPEPSELISLVEGDGSDSHPAGAIGATGLA